MGTFADHLRDQLETTWSWGLDQSVLAWIVAVAAALAILWVLSILLRVILVAIRAAFRGL